MAGILGVGIGTFIFGLLVGAILVRIMYKKPLYDRRAAAQDFCKQGGYARAIFEKYRKEIQSVLPERRYNLVEEWIAKYNEMERKYTDVVGQTPKIPSKKG